MDFMTPVKLKSCSHDLIPKLTKKQLLENFRKISNFMKLKFIGIDSVYTLQ